MGSVTKFPKKPRRKRRSPVPLTVDDYAKHALMALSPPITQMLLVGGIDRATFLEIAGMAFDYWNRRLADRKDDDPPSKPTPPKPKPTQPEPTRMRSWRQQSRHDPLT
jgi:hypothetical protein